MNRLILFSFGLALSLGVILLVVASSDPDEDPRIAMLEQRITKLEGDVAAMSRRGRGSAKAKPMGERAPRGRRAEAMAAMPGADDYGSGVEARVVEAITGEEEVRGAVQDLVREEMETQRTERWERRRERIEQRSADRMDQLASDADLSEDQHESVSTLLSTERDRVFELFAEARQTMAWDEAREQAEAIRAESDAKVAELLSPTQQEAFQAMREEQAERRGR